MNTEFLVTESYFVVHPRGMLLWGGLVRVMAAAGLLIWLPLNKRHGRGER